MVRTKLHDIIILSTILCGDNPLTLPPLTYRREQTKGKISVSYGGGESYGAPLPPHPNRVVTSRLYPTDMFLSPAESGTTHNSVARTKSEVLSCRHKSVS